MNKTVLLFFASVFGILGSYIPFLFGDHDLFGGWSILMGTVGGLFGIWLGVWTAKRFS
ncbi:MAG: hypothetical protein ABI716_03040 [Candidatus Saccharibacteria bacterium]